jgi:starch synthase
MAYLPTDAVIRFEPDGYDLNRPWLLGRQSAGHGFLRAAVQGRGEGPIYGYTSHAASAQRFEEMVREFDPSAQPNWIKGDELERIGQTKGVIYLADPALTPFARLRLRFGANRYCRCGVTHTLSTASLQQMMADLLSEPVMPWDALICTSNAAVKAVQTVLEAQADYLRWRFGPQVALHTPQLPIIPLGVHTADFAFTPADKAAARQALGLAEDEVAGLYVGRLVFTGKAHPFPLFSGLQATAERTGKKLALILCGRAPNEKIFAAFLAGAAKFAPDVRVVCVDSRDDAARRNAWAAGDIFISLSDGIQETFGLTPVEAMASGLPAVVSDYDGYKDTVRDGIDGFRIQTWAPAPGLGGQLYALRHELDVINYDTYCWLASSATSVDFGQLTDRLSLLVEQPDLRRKLGEAGQARAREVYDWAHVYRQYRELWGDLNVRRAAAADNGEELAWVAAAPRTAPSRQDPFHAFGHYPTAQITHQTPVAIVPGATLETYHDRLRENLFHKPSVPEVVVLPMWAELEKSPSTVATLARAAQLSPDLAALVLGSLAKMGLVRLGPADMAATFEP